MRPLTVALWRFQPWLFHIYRVTKGIFRTQLFVTCHLDVSRSVTSDKMLWLRADELSLTPASTVFNVT